MSERMRETVLASLAAIGARADATYYAERFADLEPERFALLVVEPRSLSGALLEAFISNIRILHDLDLTPIIVLGALDEDATHVRFQSQKLSKELQGSGVATVKLNTASYGLIPEVRSLCAQGRIPVLEIMDTRERLGLSDLIGILHPRKVIFLQPSGGIVMGGQRVGVINLGMDDVESYNLSPGQSVFVERARRYMREIDHSADYIMASPLNLLAELFTTKGSGTLIRQGAQIMPLKTLDGLDPDILKLRIDSAFGKALHPAFLDQPIAHAFIERDMRGGAIFQTRGRMHYLSKFWVGRGARGEGLGRDIWSAATDKIPAFFWRSRKANPFNDWYMRTCEGMQVKGDWRIFWVGLPTEKIQLAIETATHMPPDFEADT